MRATNLPWLHASISTTSFYLKKGVLQKSSELNKQKPRRREFVIASARSDVAKHSKRTRRTQPTRLSGTDAKSLVYGTVRTKSYLKTTLELPRIDGNQSRRRRTNRYDSTVLDAWDTTIVKTFSRRIVKHFSRRAKRKGKGYIDGHTSRNKRFRHWCNDAENSVNFFTKTKQRRHIVSLPWQLSVATISYVNNAPAHRVLFEVSLRRLIF